MGLFIMRERVALVDGELEIASRPGRGTTVRATVPLAPDPPAPHDASHDASHDAPESRL
jgi:signal transduction histidine kinase